MTSWADLRAWTEEPFVRAYGEAKHLQEIVQQCGDDVRSTRLGVESVGEVAERLRLILAGFEAETDVAESALTLAMRALNEAEESVEQIRMEVEATDGRADSKYLIVSDYGVVSIMPDVVADWEATLGRNRHPHLYQGHPYKIAERYLPLVQDAVDRIMQDASEARRALAEAIAHAQVGLMRGIAIPEAIGSSEARVTRDDVEHWASMTPAAVRANWDALSNEQQKQIVAEFPELIGNLAGIPFAVRASANDKNMQAYVDKVKREHPDLEEEIRQLQVEMKTPDSPGERVHGAFPTSEEEAKLEELQNLLASRLAAEALLEGDGAVKFDPMNDSVIAVNGDLTVSPDKVITYIPGTGATMASFSDGITDMPDDVIERLGERGQSGLAFTVKDGPWSTWQGEGANHSPEEMRERGEKVAEFQQLVQLEDYPAETVAIGHSAGMSKHSAAELSGMVTDEVISIGGSYVFDEWIANPNAEYTHVQYKNDAINVLDVLGKKTPHNQDVFDKTYVDPHVDNDGFDGHVRIAEGIENNWHGVGVIENEVVD